MTKKTDYEGVAERFDENQDRHRIARDDVLGALLRARRNDAPFTVLDLGCGTGNYIAVQEAHFRDAPIRWVGVDPSTAMLERARAKVPGAELIRASAENLPFGAGEIDYAVVRFAFHHFEDKGRGLDEIARVLTPPGTMRITNIAPSYMPGWWLYRFFPNMWPVDQERFWPPQRVFNELTARGFHAELQVDYRLSHIQIRAVLADVERREISELLIADEEIYASGLAHVKKRAETNPNEVGTTELAIADVVAARGDAPSPVHWP